MTPQACVVIPVLRQVDAWLELSVRSALDQSVACDVVVVVSPDTPSRNRETLAAIRRQESRLRVITEQRQGFAAAINTGVRATHSERIGLLLSDDWLEPEATAECLKFSTDIVSSNNRKVDAEGKEIHIRNRRPYTAAAYRSLATFEKKADYLRHYFLFRRAALLAVGGVDESIGAVGPDDYDLIWTMLEHGAEASIVEGALYNKRDHAGDRLTMRSAAEQLADLEKIFDKHGIQGTERALLTAKKAKWFGKPVHAVLASSHASRWKWPVSRRWWGRGRR